MDIQSLMRQAQEMQKKMQETQSKLAETVYEGNSGGGMLKVAIDGTKTIKNINIDPSIIDPSEKEVLEDLVVAAINDAFKKCDEDANDITKNITGGMQLPPGFKL